MNGIHDLGGMHGLGPILREADKPVFHQDWERHVCALMRAMLLGQQFNLDEFRHSVERMDPAHYLESSYYEHWLAGVERLLVEKGVITADELQARMAELAKEAG
ncbi:MAG: nitrile hydratase subunit beta [Alphaproteobacteria bacterium]|nr:nitrile hydratase subunit beta [Alphaproteobacteria bacterium]